MSEVVSAADDGASVAPVDNAAEQQVAQEQAQTPTTEQVDKPQDDKPRDEKGRFVPQERVNEITRARREAERRAEALERELATLRQQQPAQHQPQNSDKPPSIADYDYDLDRFTAAMTEYAVKQADARAESRITTKAQQERQQNMQRTYAERAAKYAADNPDFDKSIDELGRAIRFSPEVVEAIAASEHGPAVAHYLAQHLDEADEVSRLPSHLAALKLGRIEAQVSAPKTKPVTNAPQPPPTLGGGSSNAQKDPQRMSYAEYKKWRQGK